MPLSMAWLLMTLDMCAGKGAEAASTTGKQAASLPTPACAWSCILLQMLLSMAWLPLTLEMHAGEGAKAASTKSKQAASLPTLRLPVAHVLSRELQAYYEHLCAVLGFQTGAQDAAGREVAQHSSSVMP